jgi:GR25 family glycosyltransferase involved in LPS biosynthesis
MIPTYIINVKERTERLAHICSQFDNKPGFDLHIIEAITHPVGAVGLWESTRKVIRMALERNEDFILICEDDHQFTAEYTAEKLLRCISMAHTRDADVLLGGIHWFNSAMGVTEDLIWVDKFTGTHFMIIYKKFFSTILTADFGVTDDSDLRISELTEHKFVTYPFIAVQKEFGYSDIRPNQRAEGRSMNNSFNQISFMIDRLENVRRYYHSLPVRAADMDDQDSSENVIPCYIIQTAESGERKEHIRSQFIDKPEYNTFIVDSGSPEARNVHLWRSHCKAISHALEQGYDVIIICGEDHVFTRDYSFKTLLKHIYEAHMQDVDLLLPGSIDCGMVVPVSEGRLWADKLFPTAFMVLFRDFFETVLSHAFDTEQTDDYALSQLTKNKMVLSPSVSGWRVFGDESSSTMACDLSVLLEQMSARNEMRLSNLNRAYAKNILQNDR